MACVVLAIVLVCSCDSSDDGIVDNTDHVAVADFSHSVPVTGLTSLQLVGINGVIEITAVANASSVTVAGQRRVKSESVDDAADFLDRLTVDVAISGDDILVTTDMPTDTGGRECIVDYDVTVPADMVVDIFSLNGVVIVEDLRASAFVDLLNGTLVAGIDLPLGGTIDMTVTNGTMVLQIPTTTSADVVAGVTNGGLQVSNLDFVSHQISDQSLTGVLGTGEGTIRLSVVNGTLSLVGD
jgi:hypothetical protein